MLRPAQRASARIASPTLTLLLAASALTACASVPNLGPRPQAKPASAYSSSQTFAGPSIEWPSARWWDAYGDAQLTGLLDEALTGSPTLAQAEARLRATQAQAQ